MKRLALIGFTLVTLGCGERGPTVQWTLRIDDRALPSAERKLLLDSVVDLVRGRVDELRPLGLRRERFGRSDETHLFVELSGADVASFDLASILVPGGRLEMTFVVDGEAFLSRLPTIDSVIAREADSDDPAPLSSLLLTSGAVGELLVDTANVPKVAQYLSQPSLIALLTDDINLAWGAETSTSGTDGSVYKALYFLEQAPVITNADLVDAIAKLDPQFNRPIVQFELTSAAGDRFRQETGAHIGDRLAIVLEGVVHGSPPIIQSRIGRRGQIEIGGGTIEPAHRLALLLRTGFLPAPVEIVKRRVLTEAR